MKVPQVLLKTELLWHLQKIAILEKGETIAIEANGTSYDLSIDDIEVKTADIPGWQIISDNDYTVALDLEISDELKTEGVARELVNKIQNLRKDKDFEVTDKITVKIEEHSYTSKAILSFNEYICGEILASSLEETTNPTGTDVLDIDGNTIKIELSK